MGLRGTLGRVAKHRARGPTLRGSLVAQPPRSQWHVRPGRQALQQQGSTELTPSQGICRIRPRPSTAHPPASRRLSCPHAPDGGRSRPTSSLLQPPLLAPHLTLTVTRTTPCSATAHGALPLRPPPTPEGLCPCSQKAPRSWMPVPPPKLHLLSWGRDPAEGQLGGFQGDLAQPQLLELNSTSEGGHVLIATHLTGGLVGKSSECPPLTTWASPRPLNVGHACLPLS